MSNALKILPDKKTMSSLEIAKLTGKTHAIVMADIKRVLAEVEIDSLVFQSIYKDSMKREKTLFNLPRRECDLVIAGYSAKYRLAIIDRWQELEAGKSKLPTHSESLRLYADLLDKQEQDKPKVRFAEIVSESSNTRCIRVWVKVMKDENNLTVGEREVFKWLVDNRYIFKESGGYLPYAKHESTGTNYFTIVIDEINGKARRMLKITGKGVVSLTSKVVEYFRQQPLLN